MPMPMSAFLSLPMCLVHVLLRVHDSLHVCGRVRINAYVPVTIPVSVAVLVHAQALAYARVHVHLHAHANVACKWTWTWTRPISCPRHPY